MKFVTWLLTLLVLAVALCFALNNRQQTTLNLWPAGIVVEAPLYLFSLGTFFAGILIGAVIAWISHVPHRLEARRLRRDIGKLRDKIEDMNTSLSADDQQGRGTMRRLKSGGFFRRISS